MTLKQIREIFKIELINGYDEKEIDVIFFEVIAHFTTISKVEYLVNPSREIESIPLYNIENALKELKKNRPLQYVLGKTLFFGLPFSVDERVLIPRQETEELVDWVLKDIDKNSKLKVLDLCTGSGCIAISLAKHLPYSEVFAVDISSEALSVAQQNAKSNGGAVQFIQKDILKNTDFLEKFDVIISNPPYVRECEKAEILPNVLCYEPHLALFVSDENPLIFYDKIADLAKKQLTNNGKLFFEINQYLAEATQNLLINKGFSSVELRHDLANNPRMLKAEI